MQTYVFEQFQYPYPSPRPFHFSKQHALITQFSEHGGAFETDPANKQPKPVLELKKLIDPRDQLAVFSFSILYRDVKRPQHKMNRLALDVESVVGSVITAIQTMGENPTLYSQLWEYTDGGRQAVFTIKAGDMKQDGSDLSKALRVSAALKTGKKLGDYGEAVLSFYRLYLFCLWMTGHYHYEEDFEWESKKIKPFADFEIHEPRQPSRESNQVADLMTALMMIDNEQPSTGPKRSVGLVWDDYYVQHTHTCANCRERKKPVILLPCSVRAPPGRSRHYVCPDCLLSYIRSRGNSCPTCNDGWSPAWIGLMRSNLTTLVPAEDLVPRAIRDAEETENSEAFRESVRRERERMQQMIREKRLKVEAKKPEVIVLDDGDEDETKYPPPGSAENPFFIDMTEDNPVMRPSKPWRLSEPPILPPISRPTQSETGASVKRGAPDTGLRAVRYLAHPRYTPNVTFGRGLFSRYRRDNVLFRLPEGCIILCLDQQDREMVRQIPEYSRFTCSVLMTGEATKQSFVPFSIVRLRPDWFEAASQQPPLNDCVIVCLSDEEMTALSQMPALNRFKRVVFGYEQHTDIERKIEQKNADDEYIDFLKRNGYEKDQFERKDYEFKKFDGETEMIDLPFWEFMKKYIHDTRMGNFHNSTDPNWNQITVAPDEAKEKLDRIKEEFDIPEMDELGGVMTEKSILWYQSKSVVGSRDIGEEEEIVVAYLQFLVANITLSGVMETVESRIRERDDTGVLLALLSRGPLNDDEEEHALPTELVVLQHEDSDSRA